MAEAILNPTPDQTFRIEGRGDYDFSRTLRLSDEAQRRGAVDEACNLRFHAFQHLADLIPDNEEVILEWEHPNTQAALHLLYRSAVDHFLIDDFELSAAMLEFLLDLDPEDHEEATWLLAFDYVALADYDAFDEVINDVSDKYPEKPLLTLWSEYRRHGSLPAGEAIRLRNHFAPYYKEFTADSHPADDAYLRDIESERPTPQAQARERGSKPKTSGQRSPASSLRSKRCNTLTKERRPSQGMRRPPARHRNGHSFPARSRAKQWRQIGS